MEPEGTHVFVQHVDVCGRIEFLDLKRILYGHAATDAATVSLRRPNALNHDDVLRLGDFIRFAGDSFLQFTLGQHPIIATVEVFVSLILSTAGGDNDGPVIECPFFAIDAQAGREIAHET